MSFSYIPLYEPSYWWTSGRKEKPEEDIPDEEEDDFGDSETGALCD